MCCSTETLVLLSASVIREFGWYGRGYALTIQCLELGLFQTYMNLYYCDNSDVVEYFCGYEGVISLESVVQNNYLWLAYNIFKKDNIIIVRTNEIIKIVSLPTKLDN